MVFGKDPIPSKSTPRLSSLQHVHGATFLTDQALQPGQQPDIQGGEMKDHEFGCYCSAVEHNCDTAASREQDAGRL